MDCVIKTHGTIITGGGGAVACAIKTQCTNITRGERTQWIALLKLKVQLSRGDAVDCAIKLKVQLSRGEEGGRSGSTLGTCKPTKCLYIRLNHRTIGPIH